MHTNLVAPVVLYEPYVMIDAEMTLAVARHLSRMPLRMCVAMRPVAPLALEDHALAEVLPSPLRPCRLTFLRM